MQFGIFSVIPFSFDLIAEFFNAGGIYKNLYPGFVLVVATTPQVVNPDDSFEIRQQMLGLQPFVTISPGDVAQGAMIPPGHIQKE